MRESIIARNRFSKSSTLRFSADTWSYTENISQRGPGRNSGLVPAVKRDGRDSGGAVDLIAAVTHVLPTWLVGPNPLDRGQEFSKRGSPSPRRLGSRVGRRPRGRSARPADARAQRCRGRAASDCPAFVAPLRGRTGGCPRFPVTSSAIAPSAYGGGRDAGHRQSGTQRAAARLPTGARAGRSCWSCRRSTTPKQEQWCARAFWSLASSTRDRSRCTRPRTYERPSGSGISPAAVQIRSLAVDGRPRRSPSGDRAPRSRQTKNNRGACSW